MKPLIGLAIAASIIRTSTAAAIARGTTSSDQLCAGKSFQENGNWYCQPVRHITYQNVGASGEYNDVVGMDRRTGACQFKPRKFSGPLAPFNEPMSIHFRGPLRLKQIAVYLPENQQERKVDIHGKREHGHSHRHQDLHRQHHHHHHHLHNEKNSVAANKRAPCEPVQWVTATINGQVVSWINDWCPDAPTAANPATSTNTPTPQPAPDPTTTSLPPPTPPSPTTTSTPRNALPPFPHATTPSPQRVSTPSSSSWKRIAHYHASKQLSHGLTFLSNQGGSFSGTWSPTSGSSLSYVNTSGTGPSSHSTTLSDTLLPSGHEIILTSSTPCFDPSVSATCGFVHPSSIAYSGFPSVAGNRLILIDFSMPHSTGGGGGGGGGGQENDQPAIWLLNHRIPLTGQYSACSCWASGCGEFDVFETLSPGEGKAKSAIHVGGVFRGGDSNYFERPVGRTARVVVGFDGSKGRVVVRMLEGEEGVGVMEEFLGEGAVRGLMEGGMKGTGSVFRVGT